MALIEYFFHGKKITNLDELAEYSCKLKFLADLNILGNRSMQTQTQIN